MSLLHHPLIYAHRIIEEDRIEETDTGWLIHSFSGKDYNVSLSAQEFIKTKFKTGFKCDCRDHIMRNWKICKHMITIEQYCKLKRIKQ